jgi:hypothetical protein
MREVGKLALRRLPVERAGRQRTGAFVPPACFCLEGCASGPVVGRAICGRPASVARELSGLLKRNHRKAASRRTRPTERDCSTDRERANSQARIGCARTCWRRACSLRLDAFQSPSCACGLTCDARLSRALHRAAWAKTLRA